MIDPIQDEALRRVSRADRLVMVASGKGGVGKSLVSISLTLTLSEMGSKVGLLDLDVHGPAAHQVFKAPEPVRATKDGLEPVRAKGVEVMSMGYLVGDQPVPVKGEGKMSLLTTLLALTNWSHLDYLIVDLPPGTGDEMILAIRALKGHPRSGALLVTIPSRLSLSSVKRALTLLKDEGINVLGVLENMAYLRCGDGLIRPFGKLKGIEVLESLPLDPGVEDALLRGEPHRSSPEVRDAFRRLALEIERRLI